MTILLVEDDKGLRGGLSFALGQWGYETLEAGNGKKAWELFLEKKPEGIILDLNLPDMDGNQLCKKIREQSEVPVLMLTARDMETDEILGLSSGADDYMTKPFSLSVLKLRLQKLLRRKEEGARFLQSGSIRMDLELMKVWQGQEEIFCSVTEYKLLKYFLENKGRVLTQMQILDAVWDCEGKFVNSNTLQVNIGRLRRKLEKESTDQQRLKTIHGIGYLWEEEE